MLITIIASFCIGFIVAAILKNKSNPVFSHKEIWEVDCAIRGISPIDIYWHCRTNGTFVKKALNPKKHYYVFDIFQEGHQMIALNNVEEAKILEKMIANDFQKS